MDKAVQSIKNDMLTYVSKVAANASEPNRWPVLQPFR